MLKWKAHYSSLFWLDDNLLPVLILWLKHFIEWLTGLSWNVNCSNVNIIIDFALTNLITLTADQFYPTFVYIISDVEDQGNNLDQHIYCPIKFLQVCSALLNLEFMGGVNAKVF